LKRYLALAIAALLAALVSLGQTPVPPAPVTNADVLEMLHSGLGADVVVAKIRNSQCQFDTSPSALKSLNESQVPQSVLLAMIEAAGAPRVTAPAPVNSAALDERGKHKAKCDKCAVVLVSSVDSASGIVTDDWFSKNQLKWVEDRSKETSEGKRPLRFLFTKYRENADYILLWTTAIGFRPYIYTVPHTETQTASISGNANTSYSNGASSFATFNGTVNVQRTYYQTVSGQQEYVDVDLVVLDGRTGRKLYESWHRGNWRWSKPDKDCIADAFAFLQKLVPQ